MYYPRFTKVIIDYFMTRKPSIPRQNRVNWHYVRDDVLFSTIKVVSRHQTTQQYGVILPIELTNDDIRNSKAYNEYYACATGEAAPKPKASARKKTSGSASSTTPPPPITTPTPTTIIVAAPRLSTAAKGKQPVRATILTESTDVKRTEAEQLKIVLKRSRQETHISQQRGSGTDEVTGSRPGVPDVPSDDSEEELSWNSSDDEDVDEQSKGREKSEGDKTDESDDDDDDEEETTKIGKQEVAESDEGDDEATESDRESEDEETREQEEDSFDPIPRTPEDNEDDDNNKEDQGLRIGLESLFTTGSTTVTHIPSPQSTMTPSIISTFTSASQLPTPPTQIPSLDLQRLPTFALVFHFEDRVKSLEDNFSNIPGMLSASESAFAKEPVQPTCQMEEPSHPVFEIGMDDQPIIQTTQHPKWFSQPKRPPTPDRD
nr:hypothetical protein [Tanacetum cinerariifolium]